MKIPEELKNLSKRDLIRHVLFLEQEIEELKTTIIKLNSRQDVCKSELEKIKSRKVQLSTNIQEVIIKVKELGIKLNQFILAGH